MDATRQQMGSATSLDGRRFTASVPRGTVQLADLVVLEPEGGTPMLAQVFEVREVPLGEVAGHVLGDFSPGRSVRRGGTSPFEFASLRSLTAEEVADFQRVSGADLQIGTWHVGGVSAPLRLRSQGFNRHTFLCGQSGSGKTYALGVVLEQLILQTALPMTVLDPNGDFVHLAHPRDDAPGDLAQRLREADTVVLRAGSDGPDALKVAFIGLPSHAQAAVAELDPLHDREEYYHWLHLDMSGERTPETVHELVSQLLASSGGQRALGQRVENLGIGSWDIWAFGSAALRPHRVTVLDLMGFRFKNEPLVAALELVERLWANRDARVPTLVVVDEAHNICPSEPQSPLQRAVTDRLVQIAAEGRKYGIWLFVSTQRPSKVHPQIVSQCDNLVLMRMNSSTDIAELGRFFGFVPTSMLELSPFFAQGELLVAGAFVPVPTQGRVGARLTREGGSDVHVPMP